MSRAPALPAAGVAAAREAFLARHPGFCGNVVAGGDVRDPERVAYLDTTLALVVRAAQRAAPVDLLSGAGRHGGRR